MRQYPGRRTAKKTGKATAAILDRPPAEGHRERQAAFSGRHAEVRQKRGKIRIALFVKDHEPGIDAHRAIGSGNVNRIAVPADAFVLLIERNPMPWGEQPRRRQTGNAGPDNGNVEATSEARKVPGHDADNPFSVQQTKPPTSMADDAAGYRDGRDLRVNITGLCRTPKEDWRFQSRSP